MSLTNRPAARDLHGSGDAVKTETSVNFWQGQKVKPNEDLATMVPTPNLFRSATDCELGAVLHLL
jgi:hypothetical protein